MQTYQVRKQTASGELIAEIEASNHCEAARKATGVTNRFGQRAYWQRVGGYPGTFDGLYSAWISAGSAQNFTGPQVYVRAID